MIVAPNAVQVKTREGCDSCLDRKVVARFEPSFGGALVGPADGRYDEFRRVWNGLIDRKPALIARCAGAADVVTAVNFAHEHDLPVSVRAGGHNVAGNAVCDGGLVIDLSGLRGVQVDPDHRTVRVAGGATLGDLDRATQAFGLAVPTGLVSATGIAGLTLHGGMGRLTRRYGPTLDNLIAAEIVTADGRLRRADATGNADLFWAGATSTSSRPSSFRPIRSGPMCGFWRPCIRWRKPSRC